MGEYAKGLEGVVAGETSISNVEGDVGRLTYRGVDIETLVDWPYEAVAWLVLFGNPPDADELRWLGDFFRREGALGEADSVLLKALPRDLHPMQALQAMIPALSARLSPGGTGPSDTPGDLVLPGVIDEEALRGLVLVARLPAVVAAYHAHAENRALPGTCLADRSALANFLCAFTGIVPDVATERAFSVTQILQMEHSFNAGTFAARVVASTLAPVEAVLAAGVAALSGTLHGGADEAALIEARKVGGPEHAQAWVAELLARKGKLMGMGHREYRRVDPRAKILKPMARSLCAGTAYEIDYATLDAIEQAFNAAMSARGKEVWANVEFYKGAVFCALGIPPAYFTTLFAMARSVGWLAHFLESRRDNRLIRPKALYVGK